MMAVPGVSVLAMMPSLLIGCAEGELTQKELEQIVTDVLIANADVDIRKFDMDVLATMEMTGGPRPDEATVVGDSTGMIVNANNEIEMRSYDDYAAVSIELPEEALETLSCPGARLSLSLPM